MEYKILGEPLPVVECQLAPGERMITEKGSMCWMSPNMQMETNAGGSLGKAFGRMFSGESMFQNVYTAQGGPGMISFAASFPGSIRAIQLAPGREDKACHAYNYRRTPRTETLFAPPGTAYIYLIYGLHHCLNLVTEEENEPAAVLLRAGVPLSPADAECCAQRRFGHSYEELAPAQRKNLLNGPGKLCQALSLTRAQDGLSLLGNELYVLDAGEDPAHVYTGKRIGIDYAQEAIDFPWRFWL